jgi:hypothetical protein
VKSKASLEAGLKSYSDLNTLALEVVRPGGIVATFSCSGALDLPTFLGMVFQAARRAGRDLRLLSTLGAGPDHPQRPDFSRSRYLKGALLAVDGTRTPLRADRSPRRTGFRPGPEAGARRWKSRCGNAILWDAPSGRKRPRGRSRPGKPFFLPTATPMTLTQLVSQEKWQEFDQAWTELQRSGEPVEDLASALRIVAEKKRLPRCLPMIKEYAASFANDRARRTARLIGVAARGGARAAYGSPVDAAQKA